MEDVSLSRFILYLSQTERFKLFLLYLNFAGDEIREFNALLLGVQKYHARVSCARAAAEVALEHLIDRNRLGRLDTVSSARIHFIIDLPGVQGCDVDSIHHDLCAIVAGDNPEGIFVDHVRIEGEVASAPSVHGGHLLEKVVTSRTP